MATKKTKSIKQVLENKNPFVKDTWAEYADNALKPKYYISRFDDKAENRFYYFKKDNEIIVGAGTTTVFGKVSTEREHLEKWKLDHDDWKHLLNITSEYGSIEHGLYGDIMFGLGVSKDKMTSLLNLVRGHGGNSNMPNKDILAFLKFQEDYKLTPLLIEASLAYQDPVTGEWLCMTIDLLAKLTVPYVTKTLVQDGVYVRGDNKGQPKMVEQKTTVYKDMIFNIDFKSNFFDKDRKSFFEVQKLQLQSGGLAIEQNFGIKVDGYFNYAPTNWRTAPSYTLYEWKITDADWELFNTYWKLAQLKGYNKPEGNMLVTEGFKSSSDYKFLTYKEYVEQVLLKDVK
jgi:hypothetical protein